MKSCELCKSAAKIYCESDQASLCWTCDSKVHSANFLVARHSRSLLCRVCHSPSPWTASGDKLGPSAVSICEKCTIDGSFDGREESQAGNDDIDDNQAVPLSNTPPPPASSSSCGDYSTVDSVLVKRKRESVADLCSEDDVECLSVQKKEVSEGIEADGRRLYNFLPLNSEGMGVKKLCKRTRAVGLDLNS